MKGAGRERGKAKYPPPRRSSREMDGGDDGGHEGEYLVRAPPHTHTHSPHFELDVEREKERRREI